MFVDCGRLMGDSEALGMSSSGKLLAVSHTYTATGPDSARVRIISAREATRTERRQYEDEPR